VRDLLLNIFANVVEMVVSDLMGALCAAALFEIFYALANLP
jgi:hypothetical protein